MCNNKSHLKYVLPVSSEVCYHWAIKKKEGGNSGAKGAGEGGRSVPDLSIFFYCDVSASTKWFFKKLLLLPTGPATIIALFFYSSSSSRHFVTFADLWRSARFHCLLTAFICLCVTKRSELLEAVTFRAHCQCCCLSSSSSDVGGDVEHPADPWRWSEGLDFSCVAGDDNLAIESQMNRRCK